MTSLLNTYGKGIEIVAYFSQRSNFVSKLGSLLSLPSY